MHKTKWKKQLVNNKKLFQIKNWFLKLKKNLCKDRKTKLSQFPRKKNKKAETEKREDKNGHWELLQISAISLKRKQNKEQKKKG